jgi:transcriptional regulator with XRE-family HTH domain
VDEDLLAEYLRARRGRLRPGDVGLRDNGQRRVPGLRREEVALLAGISADYYLRLEQGRGGQPSEQVLRALARALQLDGAATDYLLSLTAPRPADQDVIGERVPASVDNLLGLLALPAFVTGRDFDVLASNAAARVISPELTPGRNRLRSVFLVESERALYRDWAATAQRFVAVVRDVVGRGATDPAFLALVDELSTRSPEFRELWARHDVVARDPEMATLRHPVAGDLQLHLERLDITGVAGQSLIVYHPQQGSPDAERLAALLRPDGAATAPRSGQTVGPRPDQDQA